MSDSPSALNAWRWPIAVVAVAILAFFAFRMTLDRAGAAADRTGRAVGAIGERIADIGARFQSGTITQTFVSSIPQVHGTGLGNLELATAELTETITTSDERKILWDRFSLGETVSEIRVPVTYRYHLRLADPWQIEVDGQDCIVRAPAIRPSLPPAIDTERMTKRTQQDWLRFNGADQLAELERQLTPTLSDYAGDARHIDLVREESRRTVAEFVRTWLLAEGQWGETRFRSISVRFPDETTAPPTLEWREFSAEPGG